MIPSCLKDWIGVKCLTPSKSGFWINDLEGLNLRYAADIVDSDHISGLEFLKSKIEFATSLVLQEIQTYAFPYYRINSIVDEMKIGEFTKQYTAPAPLDRGVKLKIRNTRLSRIRINSVKIKIQELNYTHSIQISDGIETHSFPFTTNGIGEAEVQTDLLSKTNEVFVTMNNTNINVNKTQVKLNCGCSSKSSRFIWGSGWNGNNEANSTYGLEVFSNAECSIDELGCVISGKLTFPILYKTGLEIAKDAATTDRLNSITLLDEEKVDFLLKSFKSEYEKHMKSLIEGIPDLLKRIDDCCIVCNQSRYVYGMP